jgi:L-fuconolactonase
LTVDAYAHCGREKYLPVESLEAVMDAADVSCAVLCQHLGQFDNSYIAAQLERRPERFAGVALVDHTRTDLRDQVAGIAAQGFRGLRLTASALGESPELAGLAASHGLVQLIYAPEGVGPIVTSLLERAREQPQVPIIVSHLGNPTVTDRGTRSDEVLLLADAPNVFVQLSGLGMFCPFPYTQLDGLITRVIDAFGPDRVIWGSNYPVCGEGVADYRRDLDLMATGRWGIDRASANAMRDTTARRIWFG